MAKRKRDLRALIEKQRAALDTVVTDTVNIALGDELVPVTVVRLRPDEWQQLIEQHPPRKGVEQDSNTGYDQAGVSRAYPRVVIDGETVDAETWADIWDVQNFVNRNAVSTVIWNLNVFSSITELVRLGKAKAGQQSSSPARSGSRPAASKGGSRRKSLPTTTPVKS